MLLGYVKIPLLQVLSSAIGVYGEFEIRNDFGTLAGLININVKFNEKKIPKQKNESKYLIYKPVICLREISMLNIGV